MPIVAHFDQSLHRFANSLKLCVFCLKNVDDWSFDIFAISDLSADGHVLKYVAYEIMQKHKLVSKFRVEFEFSSSSER